MTKLLKITCYLIKMNGLHEYFIMILLIIINKKCD